MYLSLRNQRADALMEFAAVVTHSTGLSKNAIAKYKFTIFYAFTTYVLVEN